MIFNVGLVGDVISLSVGQDSTTLLKASAQASQTSPKRCYVYGHYDARGVPFYIGKGTGKRAWKDDRHSLWHRYVEKHLGNEYSVVILEDDLSSDEAEEMEGRWIAQESLTLVNWVNFGRKTDFAALDKYHQLRNESLALFANAQQLEGADLEKSVGLYIQAVLMVDTYAKIQYELGLVGRLIDEEREEVGFYGELKILDRLTLCLCRLGRGADAKKFTVDYFSKYRADEKQVTAERIKKRVAKATLHDV